MKKILLFLFFFLLFITNVFSGNKINYLEPRNNSKFVNVKSTLIIGFEKPINVNENELSDYIEVSGSKSMKHSGTVMLSEDKMKIFFKPYSAFNYNEKVTVQLKKIRGSDLENTEFKYSFNTSKGKVNLNTRERRSEEFPEMDFTVPPQLMVSININPSPGHIFTVPFSYLVLSNNSGSLFWYLEQPTLCGDFKLQPNGNFTYFINDLEHPRHIELNRNYQQVNQYYCGNGYITDIHELRVMNNGHAYVMAYDSQYVDMSKIVPGGDSNAIVIGFIVQEIDENKDVIFQWRSWDHFEITDATHENLLEDVIDYVHGNSIEIDNDGNLILSSRNMDEVTKISRTTGEIIWRLGGENNQFTFNNDPIGFSHQHAARRISNGNLTLYDNGNFHTPPFSRAIEYSLDEVNKIATLVWQYRNTPNVFGPWGGYVQRLPSGNTFISWGGTTPSITEVTPGGMKVFEASYNLFVSTYRAYKFDISTPIGIGNQIGNIPETFFLKQNYPNPFNPGTIISFALPKDEHVELKIYDLLGREIAVLLNEFKYAGEHTVEFNASGLSSGVYFYKLKTENFTDTKKMTIIK